MDIHGLQKLTLLDYPGRVACTVFLGGCDFRCPFCHNWELVDGSYPPVMNDKELLSFLEKRQGLLDGVCFTGGEPLLRKELPELMRAVRALGYRVKLDTNGAHPERLKQILDEKLADYVAMDVKSSPQHYGEVIGRPDFDPAPISGSIRLLISGDTDYEFRTTVVDQLHEEDDFRAIAQWIAGAKRYFLQAFADRDTVPMAGFTAPPREVLETYAAIVRTAVPLVEIRGL